MKKIWTGLAAVIAVLALTQSCGIQSNESDVKTTPEDEAQIQRVHILPINFSKWPDHVQLDAGMRPPLENAEGEACSFVHAIRADKTTIYAPLQTYWVQHKDTSGMVDSFTGTYFREDMVSKEDFDAMGLRPLSKLNKKFFSIKNSKLLESDTYLTTTFDIPMASISIDIGIRANYIEGKCVPSLTTLNAEKAESFKSLEIMQNIVGMVKSVKYN
jgi:hypothetical protein